MKTKQDKLNQVVRIMHKLKKRGQNIEWINDIYRELLNCNETLPGIRKTTFKIILNKDFNHPHKILIKTAKKEYTEVLKSGMFFEWFPQLTGDWDKDEKAWYSIYELLLKIREEYGE